MARPCYEIYIDLEDDNTGLDANSGVHDPAHELLVTAFRNDKKFTFKSSELKGQITDSFNKSMQFNDHDQTIYGVAIASDKKIFRRDGNEEYDVVFTKQAISDIIHDYSRKGRFNNFNIEHNSQKLEDGVYMVTSYQIDKEKGLTAPEKFKDENDGTWILGYKVVNTDIYNKFKSGEIRGFSVEGTFLLGEDSFSIENTIDELIDYVKNKM